MNHHIIQNIINNGQQLTTVFSVLSLGIGLIFLNAPTFIRVSAIVNILCSSFVGIIVFLIERKKIMAKYNINQIKYFLIGFLLNFFFPLIVIYLLFKNIQRYKLSKSLFFSIFLFILYGVSIDLNQTHIIKYTFFLLFIIHLFLFMFIKKFVL